VIFLLKIAKLNTSNKIKNREIAKLNTREIFYPQNLLPAKFYTSKFSLAIPKPHEESQERSARIAFD